LYLGPLTDLIKKKVVIMKEKIKLILKVLLKYLLPAVIGSAATVATYDNYAIKCEVIDISKVEA